MVDFWGSARGRAAWLTIVLLFCSSCGQVGRLSDEQRSEIDSVFEAVYDNAAQPGAAVVIASHGQTVYERYFGLADLETKTPVCDSTNFCIASVSKQFAAVALLQLAGEGRLSLDDPLSKFFPEFKADFYKRITLRHILSHTSGIPDARPRDDRDFVLHATDVPSVGYMINLDTLNFEPGTRYEYINPTFQLIYQIVERVTGQKFDDYMQRNVFDKASMSRTTYFEAGKQIADMAHGYAWNDRLGRYEEFDYGEESFFATKADGGLYTSVRDFLRWEQALSNGKVLADSMLREAYTPRIDIRPDANYGYQPNASYGYGFFIQQSPGQPQIIYHTGDNGGFTIYAGKVPERDLVLLFFSTRNDIDRMAIVNRVWQTLGVRNNYLKR